MQEARGASDLFLIDSAVKSNIRPTSLLFRVQPGGKWDKWDFVCLEAYWIVQNERCKQCGSPVWICHNDDGDIGVRVKDDICYFTREVKSHNHEGSATKKEKAEWGLASKTEAFRYSGAPLDAEFREAFYKKETERATTQPES